MNTDVMFSSKTDDWTTPQDFFDELNREFGFTLDPCADRFNHKCATYYTKEQDGLAQNWGGERVFCNPPYGKEIGRWVRKSLEESKKENTLVVMLIPARGGCWFCHNQTVDQLRLLRKKYPDLWGLLLKWDWDSPITFKPDGRTVHDYDLRFYAEDLGLVPTNRKFRWKVLDNPDFYKEVDDESH